MSRVDEGVGYHDARTRHGNAGSNTGRLPAFDGAEHDLPSHRPGWAAGIPRHALCQRYFASGGLGREGESRPLGIVHFSAKIDSQVLNTVSDLTSVLLNRQGTNREIFCAPGR